MENFYNSALTGRGVFGKTLGLLVLLFVTQLTYSQHIAIDLGRSETDVKIQKDDMQNLNVSFSYSGIGTFGIETSKGLFNELAIQGTYWIGELGSPKLPASKKLIEIPFGAEVSVKVLSYDVKEFKLSDYGITYKVMPVQPSVRKDQNIDEVPFEYNETVYNKDFFIEHEIASVEILGVLRGYRLAHLTVAPVSYNPLKGIIRVYNDIEIEITYSNVDAELNEYIKASNYSPYFEPVRNSLLNNPNHGYPLHPDLTKYPVKYLVVADPMFENDLAPFIEWKTKKGFEMIVAYTDEIGTTYNAIKTWVHDQYNAGTPTNPAPSFVLFVGDTPQIPATMGSSSGKMTDLYYASVDGDYFPEMYYGRFSATNSAQLIPQIAKSLYYEQYQFSDPTYLDKTTLIAGADGTWNPRVGQPTVHYATNNYWNTAHGYTDVFTYLTSPYTGCYSPEKIAVGFINYTAHCGETSWGDPSLTQSMVNNFVNQDKYPLAIGNCCLAADFGYPECIGETWMRAANKGAVVYIGSSPSSYWFEDFYWSVGAFPIQGNNNGYVPTYDETTWGAYDAPFVSDYVSAGGLMFVGNLAVTEVDIQGYPSHSSPLYYWQAYNVLGDPSMVIYHTQGSTNNVTHMPILPIGLDVYEVEAEPGSYVAISKDGVLHGAALVDSTGIVEVALEPVLSAGMVDIVVTKPQYIPYTIQVPAAALEGPYVVLDVYTINDPAGNNNGQADYSEDISIDVTLKNVGADPSAAVTATLTGTDSYVTLTSTASQNFGVIVNGETVTLDDAFSFSIADFVPNQHKAAFVLEITDGSDTWTSNLRITVQAPVLSIGTDFIVDDSGTGNNDGILDPGETALIILNITNTGSSDISDIDISAISGDALLVVNTGSVNVASLAAGESAEIQFNVTADESSPIGYPVNLDLAAEGGPDGFYVNSASIMVVIGLIPEYNMANTTVTTCVGLFYDSGGLNGNYGNDENITMTFLPANPNAMMRANFLSFDTESGYDKLFVYNGPDATSPEFPGSPFHGTVNPGTITAMNAQGALTFRFTSDGSVSRSGWEAEVQCYIPSDPPSCASNPSPADGATNIMVTTNLTWNSADATMFDVYFGPSMNPPFLNTINTNSFSPELVPNTTYYWKIVPRNAVGPAVGCPVWSFTTGDPVYLMTTASHMVGHGMFYDTGGPTNTYASNENHVMTFTPCVEGYHLKFTFLNFDTEANYDFLHIYDGPTESAPPVAGSPFSGTATPGVITSTHSTGAITFKFISDGSVNKAGWAASFLCDGPLAAVPSSNPVTLCEGNSAQLYANAVGGSGNYTYTWTPATTLNSSTVPNPIANPAVTTAYSVTVNDGTNVATADYTMIVNEAPVVNLGNDTIICVNHSIMLDATIPNGFSYLWMPGGQTTPTILVDSTGVGIGVQTYSVTVFDINGCMADASISVTFDACTFIADFSSDLSVLVYPNPAASSLNIGLQGKASNVSFTLLNHHGQVVFGNVVGNLAGTSNYQINVSNYAKGIYYLRLNTEKDVLIRKIIIQ
ncbi:MAG: T9SS type A sorting domain-containing protein [Bacteroidales bacterium]|nr:T9SS type A sorting domain-containing protein [Bacteroidales bacterium]